MNTDERRMNTDKTDRSDLTVARITSLKRATIHSQWGYPCSSVFQRFIAAVSPVATFLEG